MYKAHRYAWEYYNDRSAIDYSVCHSCDTPGCVNPAHLWLGTPKDNTRDMLEKGRRKKFYRPHKSRWVQPEEVVEIRRLYKDKNITQADLARHFNISTSQINRIVLNQIWKDI